MELTTIQPIIPDIPTVDKFIDAVCGVLKHSSIDQILYNFDNKDNCHTEFAVWIKCNQPMNFHDKGWDKFSKVVRISNNIRPY